MISDGKEVKKEQNSAEKIVLFLNSAIKEFRNTLNSGKITGTQVKVVLEALVEQPLEKETKKFTTVEANYLFNLGCEIEKHKFLLFQLALEDNVTKGMEKVEKEKQNGSDKQGT